MDHICLLTISVARETQPRPAPAKTGSCMLPALSSISTHLTNLQTNNMGTLAKNKRVIHQSNVLLIFGRMFLHIFRMEIWLTLQIPYNLPFMCQLIAHPKYSLQRRSRCWLGTWTAWDSVQSVEGLICFPIERNPYGDHTIKGKTEKNVCFIGSLGASFCSYQSYSLWSWHL